MRAVIAIPVDPTYAEFVIGLVRDALKAAYEDGLVDGQPWGPVHLLEDDQAELAYDLLARPEIGGGKHTVRIDGWEWTLEHSLRCRRAGLLGCPLSPLVRLAVDTGAMDDGDHEVRLDEAGVLLWGDDL